MSGGSSEGGKNAMVNLHVRCVRRKMNRSKNPYSRITATTEGGAQVEFSEEA